ncbi:hypothetical protein, partial [Nostoc sp.]|uniref:hypothetical protein n=1 Tax=Nostoc sp. TaxID=1180 RepID=UPI002FF5E72D
KFYVNKITFYLDWIFSDRTFLGSSNKIALLPSDITPWLCSSGIWIYGCSRFDPSAKYWQCRFANA